MSTPAAQKRAFDLFFSSAGLIVLSPVLLVLGLVIKLSDRGPVLFKQERVGFRGRTFRILKFRTMRVGSERTGPSVTKDGDNRITPIGRWLRKTKLDELPQLWNVFRGEMSLVGPRPEVPKYVAAYTPEQKKILELKPGVTDLATLEFLREEEILKSAKDVERFYLQHCVPRKVQLNLFYAERATLWEDFKLILCTIFRGWGPLGACLPKPQASSLVASIPALEEDKVAQTS